MPRATARPPGPIRVLELLVSAGVGGGPKHVFDLVTRLSRPEFSPLVAAPPDGPFFERFTKAGIEIHALALNRLNPWTLARLCRVARRGGAHLIHSHGKGAGLYGRLAAWLLGIPAVHTFHGIHYQDYSPAARWLYLVLERRLGRLTRTVITLSRAQEAEGIALGLFPSSRSAVVPNGIDVGEVDTLVASQAIPRAAIGLGPEDRVVGCVARFDPVKGLDILLETTRRLRERIPGLRLVLVGEGPEETRLRRLAGEFGLGSVVTFAGVVEDALRMFPAWDLYISASRREGLPYAVLEAMACRLPIVATDIPGHREVVIDGTTGILVPPDDPETLAGKIAVLLADRPRRERFGEAGRERVMEAFGIKPMVRRIEELYRAAVIPGS